MTRLEEIRKRDAVLHPSWFTVDDTDDCVLRVDQTLAARAIKDRRWLLALVDDLRAQLDAVEQVLNDWRYRAGIGGWRGTASDSTDIVLARIAELENALAPKAPTTTPTEEPDRNAADAFMDEPVTEAEREQISRKHRRG